MTAAAINPSNDGPERVERTPANGDALAKEDFGPKAKQYRLETSLGSLGKALDVENYRKLNWQGTFAEYLQKVEQEPHIARNAFQRVHAMIKEAGFEERIENREKVIHYKFFEDPKHNGKDAVFGLDKQLMKLVSFFEAAAYGYGMEKRILLLHGPVGSAKSTVARVLKQGLEEYSKTDEGAMYTFGWVKEPGSSEVEWSPMHEEPLLLLPNDIRREVVKELNKQLDADEPKLKIEQGLSTFSRHYFREYMKQYDGDLEKVLQHVVVKRLVLSEEDRIGIGTFQPKDEKNQDATELTGDVNYRKIAQYGSDSDPRAFNFDGEFNIANRGIIEFVEVLKLNKEFLYDLLTASQEKRIKPKKFPQIDIDEVIIGHTNEPEYRKLQADKFMEAINDRMVRIDVPYNTKVREEMRIYERDYAEVSKRVHFAPHTVEMAALFAVLTRLEEPKDQKLSLIQKAKLYDGKSVTGYTEDNIIELKKGTKREGLDGISPRFIQDTFSRVLTGVKPEEGINPFMVLNALEVGLKDHPLVKNEDERKRFLGLIAEVRREYTNIVKAEVQRAIAADESQLAKLCANYIDHVKAYTQKEKVRDPFTGQYNPPSEALMRSIEEKLQPAVPTSAKDDFRREIMNYIGALSLDGKKFDYTKNDRLRGALEAKLFEDQKDAIRLSQAISSQADRETQEKIDIVKARLIRDFGYSEKSARDVLEFVGSIFARGDVK